jgi:phage shock protein C
MSTIRTHNIVYRNKKHQVIGGVCAGIADYFGISRLVVRLLLLISLFMFTLPTIVIYTVAMFFLKDQPEEVTVDEDEDEKKLWQSMHRSPRDTMDTVRYRFSSMENRIRDMEAYLTSRKYKLDRAFDKLKD